MYKYKYIYSIDIPLNSPFLGQMNSHWLNYTNPFLGPVDLWLNQPTNERPAHRSLEIHGFFRVFICFYKGNHPKMAENHGFL